MRGGKFTERKQAVTLAFKIPEAHGEPKGTVFQLQNELKGGIA
jgi:hypothetical protein